MQYREPDRRDALRWVLYMIVMLSIPARAMSAQLSFVPVTTNVSCTEARPVDVWIDGAIADLRGASLVMRFDPFVVRPVAIEEGQLFIDDPCPSFLRWNNEDAVGDSIFVDVAGLGCSVQGPGPILRIWVTGVADGSTLLWGSMAQLRNASNSSVVATWTPGHIVVSCPIGTDDQSWSTLKAAYYR